MNWLDRVMEGESRGFRIQILNIHNADSLNQSLILFGKSGSWEKDWLWGFSVVEGWCHSEFEATLWRYNSLTETSINSCGKITGKARSAAGDIVIVVRVYQNKMPIP